MQIAELEHMSLVRSYVPAATKILSTALLPTAAVSSATLLTETWFSFRPCSTMGPEGARPSFTISPAGMLATAMDSWTRLRSIAPLCICRTARHRSVTPIRPGAMLGQGAARGQGRRRCGESLKVLCERCAVHAMAQLALGAVALWLPGRQSPCEGTGKAGRGGTGERVRFCGALLLELVFGARAALLPCEAYPELRG